MYRARQNTPPPDETTAPSGAGGNAADGALALAIVAAVLSWPITTILGVLLCVPSLALSVYLRKRNPGNRAALGALILSSAVVVGWIIMFAVAGLFLPH